jgi:hypothetical protein
VHDATFAIQESLWSEHFGISPVLAIHVHTPNADQHSSSLATTQDEHSDLIAQWRTVNVRHLNEDTHKSVPVLNSTMKMYGGVKAQLHEF